jgi:branched-chain amino acid transport system permease protein
MGSTALLLTQLLNGIQLGMLLFLLSAGLTLVLGIMNFVNLAHGSLYMLGAFFGAHVYGLTQSFAWAVLAAVGGSLVVGLLVERLVAAALYRREHLDQVLATFGLLLLFNEVARVIWQGRSLALDLPAALSGSVDLLGIAYPSYRLAIIAVGCGMGVAMYLLIQHTRVGMLIRAGASNPGMVSALGVDVRRLSGWVFGLGAALAGLAGMLAAPILSVQVVMGEPVLILALVVIVTGGIGSVKGAFYGALLVGLVDTVGRAFLPNLLRAFLDPAVARGMGPAIASMAIYLSMAVVLIVRPHGLFGGRHG